MGLRLRRIIEPPGQAERVMRAGHDREVRIETADSKPPKAIRHDEAIRHQIAGSAGQNSEVKDARGTGPNLSNAAYLEQTPCGKLRRLLSLIPQNLDPFRRRVR
jgi:hypothetical protein